MKAETELKLALTPRVAKKLIHAKGIKAHRLGPARSRRLISTYFDTPEFALQKSGISLRVRDDGEQRTQTIKVPIAGPPGLQNQQEWTVPLSQPHPEVNPERDGGVLPDAAFDTSLQPVFTTDIRRTTVPLQTPRAEVEMAIDTGEIRSASDTETVNVCEAEFELVSGHPGDILDLALQVCEDFDVRPAHQTKAQRGYSLTNSKLGPKPAQAKHQSLHPGMTVLESFQLIVDDTLRHLFENQAPTLYGDPEGVHQTRVAMRRIRAALQTFTPVLPKQACRSFDRKFRHSQRRLAPARDWHVFMTETLPLISETHGMTTDQLAILEKLAKRQRRLATKAAIRHLQSSRYTRLILKFQRWAGDLPVDAPGLSISAFAFDALETTRNKLLKEQRPLRRLSLEELHKTRKRGKKARYAMEFFSPLWSGKEVDHCLKQMKHLQSHLGEANDAGVARSILQSLEADPEIRKAIEAWSQERIQDRVHAARHHWRRFRKTEPFWRSE